MNLNDDRISKFQRQIFDWLKELYPSFSIELEKLIPSTNQRIDIYIHQLELAIECDGSFHSKPSFFFVKTIDQWNDILYRDKLKNKTLDKYGIDLIRIPYNHKMKSSKDLEFLIDSFFNEKNESVSNFDERIFIDSRTEKEQLFREKIKQRNKEQYLKYKESDDYLENKKLKYEESKKYRPKYDDYKDIIKQRRKEQYLKYKESKK